MNTKAYPLNPDFAVLVNDKGTAVLHFRKNDSLPIASNSIPLLELTDEGLPKNASVFRTTLTIISSLFRQKYDPNHLPNFPTSPIKDQTEERRSVSNDRLSQLFSELQAVLDPDNQAMQRDDPRSAPVPGDTCTCKNCCRRRAKHGPNPDTDAFRNLMLSLFT